MISDLFFTCPRCGCFHCVKGAKRGTHCVRCQVSFAREGDKIRVGEVVRPSWEWYDQIVGASPTAPTPAEEIPLEGSERLLARSEIGRLRQVTHRRSFEGFGEIRASVEQLDEAGVCRIALTNQRFLILLETGTKSVPLGEITCITTDAREFVFRVADGAVFHVEFPSQSPLFWELVSRRALRDYWAERGVEVVEYQPWVRFRNREKPVRRGAPLVDIHRTKDRPKDSIPYEVAYSAIRWLAFRVFRWYFGLELRGRENLPRTGPFIVILNHEGYLDSFFALAALPVKIGFLAKNTEFKNAFNRRVMRLFRSIPVHRHRPDPVALLNVVRLLRKGAPVALFPEGERTWDGRRLRPKRTAVKLLMRAGVPIVPCRIQGSFAVMPRWDHHLQRRKVVIWVGKPFHIPKEITEIDKAIDFVGQRIDELGENLDSEAHK